MALLTYHSKYIVQSASTVTTSSSTLANDTQATQTFSLASTKTVLIIYTASSTYSRTNGVGGIKNAINVDGTDVSQMNDSGYAANSALRNSCMWVGALGSGSHTINGRLASAVNAQTTTVDNRTLLIYVFNGNEFTYIDDTTAQTASATTYVDDSYATTTFTPSSDCKALVFYAITNLKGSTERYTGKKICINIAGEDKYGEAAKSSNSAATSPDSLATAFVQALTAVSTTIKGRLATNTGTQTVTADRHVLGVLLLNPSVVLDSVASITPVSSTSTVLVNDTEASITRTRSATNELLILGQATKERDTTGSQYGLCYGLNVDNADVALSRSSPAYTSDAESSLVTYAVTVAAGSHTINGRLATNGGSLGSVVDTRILIALWFPIVTLIQTTSSISGGGSSTAALLNINRIHSTVLGGGSQTSNLIAQDVIYSPPGSLTADFSGTPLTGYLPLTVQFTDSSTVPTSIVGNSDFEAGLPPSTSGVNVTIAQSSTYKRHGVYSMRVIATAASGDNYVQVNQGLVLTSNTQYYWEVYVYSPVETTIYVSGMLLQEDGGSWRGIAWANINGNSEPQSIPASTWVKIYGAGTTGSGWGTSRLLLRPAVTGAEWDTTHYIYYDDLKVYPITWAWTFGDTATASTQNPSHQYTTKGVYEVGLTVTTGGSSNLKTSTSYVAVNELQNISTSCTGSGSVTSALASLNKSVTGSISGGGTLTASASLDKTITSFTVPTSLVDNSDFEVGLPSNTTGMSTTIVQSSTYKRSGTYSMRAIATSTTADCFIPVNSGLVLTSNTQFYWEIYVYSPDGATITPGNMFLQEAGGSWRGIAVGAINGSDATQSLPVGSWVKICGTGTTGSDWIPSRLVLRPGGNDSAWDTTHYIYYDDLNVCPSTGAWTLSGGGSETSALSTNQSITGIVSGEGFGTSNIIKYNYITSSVMGGGYGTAIINELEQIISSISAGGSETANIIEFEILVSSISGGGSETSALSTNQSITGIVSGEGFGTSNIIKYNYITSSVMGGGYGTAIINELKQTLSLINGGGSQTSDPITLEQTSSILAAAGALTAEMQLNTGLVDLYSVRVGSGSETANIIEFGTITSTVTGGGLQTAVLSSPQIITSSVSGGGNTTANIIECNYISSNISGMGTSIADIIEWNYISSNISGVGSQTSNITPLTYIASVISGVGSTQAAISVNQNISSIVSGSGSQTANDIVFGLLSGIVIGIGHSSANLTFILVATPHFDHPQTLIINQNIRAITIFRNDRTVTIENGFI